MPEDVSHDLPQQQGWTVETSLAYVLALIDSHDRRYQQRFDQQQEMVKTALVALEDRFRGVNEFRATLADQQRTLMPRQESEALHAHARQRIESMESIVERMQAERAGLKGGWSIAIAAVGLVALITSIILRFKP